MVGGNNEFPIECPLAKLGRRSPPLKNEASGTFERYHHIKHQHRGRYDSPDYSPVYDQGYHTLVSPPIGTECSSSSSRHHWIERRINFNYFSMLGDHIILKIFSWFTNVELVRLSEVCQRFHNLVWLPRMWKNIHLKGAHINGDRAIQTILYKLKTSKNTFIERIFISDGAKLTDFGIELLMQFTPEITHLQIQGCTQISNSTLLNFIHVNNNLQHLDLTGCIRISTLSTPNVCRKLMLQYLDLTDCSSIDDNGLRTIVINCPQLIYLYLRRCVQITDTGIKCIPSFCLGLKELSVSDCSNLTDFGLYELAKLGATLRYLSVAKCDRVSDPGLKVIVRRCYKLRYLNCRGCEAVSDDAIQVLARSCPRLRALDIGKCDITDNSLRQLAESCPNLKKLSLKSCDLITDKGLQYIAYYCRGLQLLNIQDCQITIEAYRAVKQFCKRCVIEHTNPGFF